MTPTQQLRRQLLEEQAHRQGLEMGIRDLLAHLDSAKFQGDEPDGGRRDWISTTDVNRRLQDTLQQGLQARDLEVRYRWAILPAADSVDRLRAIDLDRVLEPLADANLPGFVDWLIAQRPDLADRIRLAQQGFCVPREAEAQKPRHRESAPNW